MHADREVARDGLLSRRRVRGARGHVDRVAGRYLDVERRTLWLARRIVHLPSLAPERLQHEDVVRIVVQVEPLRAGRRDVRVHLAGMTELELESCG